MKFTKVFIYSLFTLGILGTTLEAKAEPTSASKQPILSKPIKPVKKAPRLTTVVHNNTNRSLVFELTSPKFGKRIISISPKNRRTFFLDLIGTRSRLYLSSASNPAYPNQIISIDGFSGQEDYIFYEQAGGKLVYQTSPKN